MINIAYRSLSKTVAKFTLKKCKQAEWHSMSSAQQYLRELPSHSSLEQSASKNYKEDRQPLQTIGKGPKNHWIFFFSCRITVSVIEQLNLIKHQSLIDDFHALT